MTEISHTQEQERAAERLCARLDEHARNRYAAAREIIALQATIAEVTEIAEADGITSSIRIQAIRNALKAARRSV